MHTNRSTLTRAVALGALLLAACAGDQGLGRQPAAHRATSVSTAPTSPASTTSPTSTQPAARPTTLPAIPTTVPPIITVPTTAPNPEPPPTAAPRPRSRPTLPTLAPPAMVDGLPRQLRRIGGCESTGDPDGPLLWTQPNLQGSTASGAFQMLDSTYRTWSVRYGAGTDATEYSRAMHAPPTTQVTLAVRAHAAEGTQPWLASAHCWRG